MVCSSLVLQMSANKKNDTLQEYIRKFLELPGNSETKIAEKSNFAIKQSSVNDLKNGRVQAPNATISTIFALAKGMERRPFEVFAVALGISLREFGIRDENTEVLTEADILFNQLSPDRRNDILGIMKYFLENELTVTEKGTSPPLDEVDPIPRSQIKIIPKKEKRRKA